MSALKSHPRFFPMFVGIRNPITCAIPVRGFPIVGRNPTQGPKKPHVCVFAGKLSNGLRHSYRHVNQQEPDSRQAQSTLFRMGVPPNPFPYVTCSVLIGVETYAKHMLATSVGITGEQGPDCRSGLKISTSQCSGLAFGRHCYNHTANGDVMAHEWHSGFFGEGMPQGGMGDCRRRRFRFASARREVHP